VRGGLRRGALSGILPFDVRRSTFDVRRSTFDVRAPPIPTTPAIMIRPVLLAAALLAAAVPASAAPCEPGAFCKCLPITAADAFGRADAVFRGTIVAARDVESDERRLYTVRVERAYKGGVAGEVTVAEPMHGTSCMMFLEVGTSYLLTAKRGETGTLRLSPCENVPEDAEAGLAAGAGGGTAPAGTSAAPAERVARGELRRDVLRRVRTLLAPRTFAAVRLDVGAAGPGTPVAAAAGEIASAMMLDPRIYVVHSPPSGDAPVRPAPTAGDAAVAALVRAPAVLLRVTASGDAVRVEGRRAGEERAAFAVESPAGS
jgi:hypothetical protein